MHANFHTNTMLRHLQTTTKYVVNAQVDDDDDVKQTESTAATTEKPTNQNSSKENPSYFAIILEVSLAVSIGESRVFSRNYSTISIGISVAVT